MFTVCQALAIILPTVTQWSSVTAAHNCTAQLFKSLYFSTLNLITMWVSMALSEQIRVL